MGDYYAEHLAILAKVKIELTAGGGLAMASETQLETAIATLRTAYTGPVMKGNPGSDTLVALLAAKAALSNSKNAFTDAVRALSKYILIMKEI